jgi:hypothetical protein
MGVCRTGCRNVLIVVNLSVCYYTCRNIKAERVTTTSVVTWPGPAFLTVVVAVETRSGEGSGMMSEGRKEEFFFCCLRWIFAPEPPRGSVT